MELKGILICHYFSSRKQLNNYTVYEEGVCNTLSHYRIELPPFPFILSENKGIPDTFSFDHNLRAPEWLVQLCSVVPGVWINCLDVKHKR